MPHFGLSNDSISGGSHGFTSDTPKEAQKKIYNVREAKYIMLSKSMNFGGMNTGMTINLSFGDIFLPIRIGVKDEHGLGTSKSTFQRFTIDIPVGPEVVTLYTHEVVHMTWLNIMELRRDKLYIEQFLTKDCPGYWAPTEAGKNMLINNFGDR